MFAVAVRRQTLIAVLAVTGVVVQSAVSRSLGAEVVVAGAALALVCLLPVIFAWGVRSYRIAVGLLGALLTLASLRAVFGGSPDLLPAAVASWLALASARQPAGVTTLTEGGDRRVRQARAPTEVELRERDRPRRY